MEEDKIEYAKKKGRKSRKEASVMVMSKPQTPYKGRFHILSKLQLSEEQAIRVNMDEQIMDPIKYYSLSISPDRMVFNKIIEG